MRRSLHSLLPLLFLMIAVAHQVQANSDHSHTSHGAHLHGSAELTLAIEGNQLEINLESPAANIVGFEHRASSPRHFQAVNKATSALESAENLFAFLGSTCTLMAANINMPDIFQQSDTHALEDDHQTAHSEITATYRYNCQNGSQLNGISVYLNRYFPAIEKLKIMWLTDDAQGTTELTHTANLIQLK